MIRGSLVSRVAALSGLLLVAGCSKEIDFSVPATLNVNSTGGVPYSTVRLVDLSVEAADAWSHRDKVKDLSLVDVTGTVLSTSATTTGSGSVALRPATKSDTDSSGDIPLGTYTGKSIATGQSVIVTLVPEALDILNNALQADGKFKVVASGTTAATAYFVVEFTLHLKMNYKII
jgi:hypothetical protein